VRPAERLATHRPAPNLGFVIRKGSHMSYQGPVASDESKKGRFLPASQPIATDRRQLTNCGSCQGLDKRATRNFVESATHPDASWGGWRAAPAHTGV